MSSETSLLLYMSAVPLGMLAIIAIAGRLFRRRVETSMRQSAAPDATVDAAPMPPSSVPELQILRVDPLSATVPMSAAAAEFAQAKQSRRRLASAFIAAAVAFTAISSITLVSGMVSEHHYGMDAPVALAYMLQWVPLIIVLWVLDLRWKVRLGALAVYAAMGLLLVLIAASWMRPIHLFKALVPFTIFFPLTAVIPLLIRRLRPWLVGLMAILLFLLVGMAAVMIARVNIDVAMSKVWTGVLGGVYAVSAIILVRWLLQREIWHVTAVALGALTVAGVIFVSLHRPAAGMTLLGLPGNVVQVLLVWATFKAFVTLQEKQLLPARVLHSHLCWGALTLWLLAAVSWGGSLYGHRWWAPWAVVSSYVLYLLVLHLTLRKIWLARRSDEGKRLLLLRVFGHADERERLLDWLDESWRFIGRIDLIAGTDLAERTLGARMLEAFLLRRTDQMFLRTPGDVDKRLATLRSQLEGDGRYPANSVYCYASAWREAVERLAPASDAVLMDLRGFSSSNRGCIFELTWIVQRLCLSKILLLTDDSTDHAALEQTIQSAWSSLPADSPSANTVQPKLRVVQAQGREAAGGLFALLLIAASTDAEATRVGRMT